MNAWLAYLHDRIVYIENTTDWFIICVSYGLQLINATIIFLRHDFHIESSPQAIDTWGCIFVSMNCVSNGSGNGLLHFWQKSHYLNQVLPFVTFETNWNELLSQMRFNLFQENSVTSVIIASFSGQSHYLKQGRWFANMFTHCVLLTSYGSTNMINNGSGNGVLPNGTKPLPEPILTFHQWGPVALIWNWFQRKCSKERT